MFREAKKVYGSEIYDEVFVDKYGNKTLKEAIDENPRINR